MKTREIENSCEFTKNHVNDKLWAEIKDKIMTSPAAPLSTEDEDIFEAANETSIHYSRPATIFAAVAASIFTFVGITGKPSHLL